MTAYRENARTRISDLDDVEKGALATLIRTLVRADGDISDEERSQIEDIVGEVGGDEFWRLLDAAAESEDVSASTTAAIASVNSKDAQELIYGALYELSIVDGSGSGENELLDRLTLHWELVIRDTPADQ